MKYIHISCDYLIVIIYSLINLNDFAICTFATVTKMLVSCLTDNKTLKVYTFHVTSNNFSNNLNAN